MENKHYETKLYTTIGDFTSPFSLEETRNKIKEGNGVLKLTRFAISNRIIRDEKTGEQTSVDANTKISVELDTNICPILCYEEYEITDVERPKKNKK